MDGTRRAIIQAFDQLLEEKPISKITVKDIAERCQINRNTFYYHFEGIPSMVDEIMDNMAEQVIESHIQSGEPIECLRPFIQYAMVNKNKLIHVYSYIPREEFMAYLNRIFYRLVKDLVDNATVDAPISDENAAALVQFYKCAIVGIVLDWMDNNMKDDLMALMERLYELFKGTSRIAMSRA